MKKSVPVAHESYPDTHHDNYSRTTFGFWLYIMSDFILFGALFAAYIVLSKSTFGGPAAKTLFKLPYNFLQTCIFLVSALTAGLGGASAHRKDKNKTLLFFAATFLLGVIFIGMQFNEFHRFSSGGNGWDQSAFLSAYFTLVGTHSIHVLFGLLWIIVLLLPVWNETGISHVSVRRLTCLRMFWQFLNIIWMLIFSFVYLMGAK